MTESTTGSTEVEEVDGAKIDDNRVGKRMKRNYSRRTYNPEWSYSPKSKRHDDGQHWKPAPPPYRRG